MNDKEEPKARWSAGGQLFIHYGKAYAVSELGGTICLGDEKDIEKALSENTMLGSPDANKILRAELDCRNRVSTATAYPKRSTMRK